MALEEFEKEQVSDRDKSYLRMRSIMDYGMGVLWAAMGVFMIFIEKFNSDLAVRFDPNALKVFGGVCIIYVLFIIYRVYKKKYFRDR